MFVQLASPNKSPTTASIVRFSPYLSFANIFLGVSSIRLGFGSLEREVAGYISPYNRLLEADLRAFSQTSYGDLGRNLRGFLSLYLGKS